MQLWRLRNPLFGSSQAGDPGALMTYLQSESEGPRAKGGKFQPENRQARDPGRDDISVIRV